MSICRRQRPIHVVVVCGLLLGASGAQAGDKLPTMREVLAMCASEKPADQRDCGQAVDATAGTTYEAAGNPGTDVKLCLPPPTREGLVIWREKMIAWTRKHPEKQSLTVVEALYPLVADSFRCDPASEER